MTISIPKRKRIVSFTNGVPTVIVQGERRRVSVLLGDGDSNVKTAKNAPHAMSVGLSLAAHKSAGAGNVCPHAASCATSCLDDTGMGAIFKHIKAQRIAKTVFFQKNRPAFLNMLRDEIRAKQTTAENRGKLLAVRLNMFSDIAFERYGIPQEFPDVQFYDYTKNPARAGQICSNYWVTFSRDETNDAAAVAHLKAGKNVAVCFYNPGKYTGNRSKLQMLPETWKGFRVIDGDVTDARWTDPRGVVVGLKLKAANNAARQRAIDSGFAVRTMGMS